MMNQVAIELQESVLDEVTGGTTRTRNISSSFNRSFTVNAQRTNNASVYLANMTVNAGTSGDHNIGGLAITITQGIQ
jgi:hypothetical protein